MHPIKHNNHRPIPIENYQVIYGNTPHYSTPEKCHIVVELELGADTVAVIDKINDW